jgi:hypothetical protein
LKVKIIKDGVETAINPDTIVIGTITLKQFLDRFIKLENEFTKKFAALEKKDAALKEAVRKL